MNKTNILSIGLVLSLVVMFSFFPEAAHAQFAGGFESKMQGLTNKLITVVLPLISILGLVYAVILAVTGDAGAKMRIVMVIGCSVVGFLAPHIISWFQSASGQ